MRNLEWFHDHARIERLLFDGVVEPERGELRPELSRPGLGLELKRVDTEQYLVSGPLRRLGLREVADAALFVHLVGAFMFVAGIVVASIAHGAARRRHHAGEIALLLGIARTGALLVLVGAVLVLAFGLWLVDLRGHSLGETWIAGALTLFVLAVVHSVGAVRAKPGYWQSNSRRTTSPSATSCDDSSRTVSPLSRTTPRSPPSSRFSLSWFGSRASGRPSR